MIGFTGDDADASAEHRRENREKKRVRVIRSFDHSRWENFDRRITCTDLGQLIVVPVGKYGSGNKKNERLFFVRAEGASSSQLKGQLTHQTC